jgi:hypothetical protein
LDGETTLEQALLLASSEYNQFRTGYGDTLGNAITLSENAVGTPSNDGIIPAGDEAHIKVRIDVPAAETESGTVYFDIIMAYTATS